MNQETTTHTAEELLDMCVNWSKQDRDNHTAIVLLRDGKKGYFHLSGGPVTIARLIYSLMEENEEMAENIFKAATLFAYKNISQEIIASTNADAKAIAEARAEMESQDKSQADNSNTEQQ